MKFVITGASSFIGLELCRFLLSNGNEVVAITRKKKNEFNEFLSDNSFRLILSDMQHLSRDIINESADVFINLAWQGTGHDGRDVKDIQAENIKYTLKAMQAAHELGCRLFVESGSQAEYGTQYGFITEETECKPFSEYGKAKLEVWRKGHDYCKSVNMKYMHLRIFSIFGETDHPWTLVMSLVDKLLKDETIDLSSCKQIWNFLYVKDGVDLISRLCNYACNEIGFTQEVFHIASATSRPLKDYVERIKELTKSNSMLNYGAISTSNAVSLNVSVEKSYKATQFVENYTFDEVINRIIEKHKKR